MSYEKLPELVKQASEIWDRPPEKWFINGEITAEDLAAIQDEDELERAAWMAGDKAKNAVLHPGFNYPPEYTALQTHLKELFEKKKGIDEVKNALRALLLSSHSGLHTFASKIGLNDKAKQALTAYSNSVDSIYKEINQVEETIKHKERAGTKVKREREAKWEEWKEAGKQAREQAEQNYLATPEAKEILRRASEVADKIRQLKNAALAELRQQILQELEKGEG